VPGSASACSGSGAESSPWREAPRLALRWRWGSGSSRTRARGVWSAVPWCISWSVSRRRCLCASASPHLRSLSLPALARQRGWAVSGIGLLLALPCFHLYTEYCDYDELGLGWVQAKYVEGWADSLRSGQDTVPISGRRFGLF